MGTGNLEAILFARKKSLRWDENPVKKPLEKVNQSQVPGSDSDGSLRFPVAHRSGGDRRPVNLPSALLIYLRLA